MRYFANGAHKLTHTETGNGIISQSQQKQNTQTPFIFKNCIVISKMHADCKFIATQNIATCVICVTLFLFIFLTTRVWE